MTLLTLSWNSKSRNSRGKFIILILDIGSESPVELSFRIYDIFWTKNRVVDVLIMTYYNSSERTCKSSSIGLFTGFPYRNFSCGVISEVVPIEEFCIGKPEYSLVDLDFFPPKIPKKFDSCTFTISTIGLEPYVIPVRNNISQLVVHGLTVEFIVISARELSFSIAYLEPKINMTIDNLWSAVTDINEGVADILVGLVLLHPILTRHLDPSIPYI
jgi:hypothetical protein